MKGQYAPADASGPSSQQAETRTNRQEYQEYEIHAFGSRDKESERTILRSAYATGLIVLGPWMPIVAVIFTLISYLVPATNRFALVLGCGAGLAFWLLGAVLARTFATPGKTNPTSFQLLLTQACLLEAHTSTLPTSAQQQQLPGQRPEQRDAVARGGEQSGGDARGAFQKAYSAVRAGARRLGAVMSHTELRQPEQPVEPLQAEAHKEVETYTDRLSELIRKHGAQWVIGSAYAAGWRFVSRAEEALILLEVKEAVLRDALYDKSRLEGSTIEGRDNLLAKLRAAAVSLVPEAADCFDLPPQTQQTSKTKHDGKQGDDEKARVARARLRDVRRKINEFRAERWEGLIRERNQMLMATMLSELLLLLLLILAIISQAPLDSITGAGTIFLIGASVGLFNRLHSEYSRNRNMDATVDDYGLSVVRLMLVPLLSGLSALGGVLLMLTLYGAFIGQYIQLPHSPTPTPTPTAVVTVSTASTTTTYQALPSTSALQFTAGAASVRVQQQSPALDTRDIAQIYDLEQDPYALVLAAVFGLAPALLISMLQQQANRYETDLRSSQASVSSHSAGS